MPKAKGAAGYPQGLSPNPKAKNAPASKPASKPAAKKAAPKAPAKPYPQPIRFSPGGPTPRPGPVINASPRPAAQQLAPLRAPAQNTVTPIAPPTTRQSSPNLVVVEHVGTSGNGNVKAGLASSALFLLIIASNMSSGNMQKIWAFVTQPGNAPTVKEVHSYFITVGGEIVFLIILSMIAQTSEDAANFVLLFAVTLWILWLFSKIVNKKEQASRQPK